MHRKPIFLRIFILTALIFGSFTSSPAAPAPAWQTKVDGWVLQTTESGETEFLVFLQDQADLSAAARLPTRLEKGEFVYQTLLDHARRTQKPLLDALDGLGVQYQPFYIANMVWVRGGADVVQTLAQRADVARLYANPAVQMPQPQISPEAQSPEAIAAVEWNILKVNADDAWAAGYTGQGVVIGGQDTGYDWDHPALKNQYRGWNGSSADHNYSWHDAIHVSGSSCGANSLVPCDDHGHGTHTMGTMVGDDGLGNQIGMAPGARWIGCRNMNSGVGTPATYAECYEWFIAPYPLGGTPAQGDPSMAPDVINNSWGCPPSEGCTDPNVLLTVVDNVRAAGILTAHSAGNSGSACSSIDEPAAIYAASFSVGATDSNDNIASFSSRGPVTVDGSNRLKPEISAPGVSIRSSVPGGSYEGGWSGTSMASPHVAGMAALLMSIDPSLKGQVDSLETIIEQSAVPRTTTQTCGGVPGSTIPNNTYGWGRIDVLAAMQNMVHELTIQKTASASTIAPGQAITYTIDITHVHPSLSTGNVVLTDTLPAGVSLVFASPPYTQNGSTLTWTFPSLGPNEGRTVEIVVQTPPNATGSVVNSQYGVRSDDVDPVTGPPVATSIVPYSLGMQKSAPPAVTPGGLVTYTLQVTNLHPTAIQHNLVLTDTLPAGTTFVTATLPYVINADTVAWMFPNVQNEKYRRVNLVVQAPDTNGATITNQDYGAATDESAVSGAAVITEVISQDLELNKTGPGFAQSGSVFTYTLAVQNPHPAAAAHNVVLTDTLPAHASLVRAIPGFVQNGDLLTWTLPSLGPGATWNVNLVVSAPLTYTGVITNSQYGVRSDEVTTQTGAPVVTQIHSISLEKTASSSIVNAGDLITYTLTVENLHPTQSLTDLVLTDVLPAGTAFVSSDTAHTLLGNQLTWTAASLGAGDVWVVHLVVRVAPGASGSITNQDYGVHSQEVAAVISGPPVVSQVKYVMYLPVINK
jgi:serine protease AprX